MYNSINHNEPDDKGYKVIVFLSLVLVFIWIMMLCNSCRSERNNNYPVVHKDKLMNASNNPNRK